MQILFAGDVHTDYNLIYVESRPDSDAAFETAFNGQVNGLCGGASPGFLYLSTGLHAGHVGFTVELHEEAPPVDDSWEDVVEVTFRPGSETLHVIQLFREAACSLAVPQVDLRVRYCASGMDAAAPLHFVPDDEPTVDRYLLQFWPAPPSADRVLRQTSAAAAHRHEWVRTLPPPPTPEEQAEAERRIAEAERQAQLEAQERWERRQEEMFWGGVRPSERLRNLQANVIGLAQLDRALGRHARRGRPGSATVRRPLGHAACLGRCRTFVAELGSSRLGGPRARREAPGALRRPDEGVAHAPRRGP